MARQPRIEFKGATYHIMCRGNHQELVYRDDGDCELFLKTLEEVASRNGWLVHAYVLMGNHYHLLLETPEANLVDGMRWLQSTYTQRFNARHQVWGHLFQGRYKALLVDEGEYFSTVASYIHLNPARAHCFDLKEGALADYRWSSFRGYLNPKDRPSFLVVKRVLGGCYLNDTASGRSAYKGQMDQRVQEIIGHNGSEESDVNWKKIRRGWVLGSPDFVEQMKEKLRDVVAGKRRDSFMGEEIRMHDEKEAARLVEEGLKVCGISAEELPSLKKSDNRKKVIAWRIRKKTSVQIEWICTHLYMGSRSNFARYIRAVDDAEKGGELWGLRERITKKAD